MGPNWNNNIGLYFQNQSLYSTYVGHNKVIEPYPKPQNILMKGPTRAKTAHMGPNLKKRNSCIFKTKIACLHLWVRKILQN